MWTAHSRRAMIAIGRAVVGLHSHAVASSTIAARSIRPFAATRSFHSTQRFSSAIDLSSSSNLPSHPPPAFEVPIESEAPAAPNRKPTPERSAATPRAARRPSKQPLPPTASLPACHEGVDWERTSVWRFDGKAHQMRCLMDPCPHPSRMFRSLYTLRGHMRTQHQRRVTSATAERLQAEAHEGIARRGIDYGPSRDPSLRNASGTRMFECFVPGCAHPTRLFKQSVNLRTHLLKAHQLVLPKLKLT